MPFRIDRSTSLYLHYSCLFSPQQNRQIIITNFLLILISGSKDHKPKELLPVSGKYFEDQIQSLVDNVLTPAGFEVVSWSRVPYLCEGDLQQSYYWLDDSIFVLKSTDS